MSISSTGESGGDVVTIDDDDDFATAVPTVVTVAAIMNVVPVVNDQAL